MANFIKIHAFTEGAISRDYFISVINSNQIVQIRPQEDFTSIICTNAFIQTDETVQSLFSRINNSQAEIINMFGITWDETYPQPETRYFPFFYFESNQWDSNEVDIQKIINLELNDEIKTNSGHITIKRIK